MKNRKIKVNVGVPGSGKTTWSKAFVENNPNWVRICRDDFRFMLKNAPFLSGRGEELITNLVNESTERALLSGFNVILDATHVKLSYINSVIKTFGEMADIEFEVFDVPIEECLKRDSEREKKVGREVIEKMQSNFDTLKKEFDFQPVPQRSRMKRDFSEDWGEGKTYAFITDIDGTVAHMNGKRGPFDWKKVGLDDPDHPMISTLQALKSTGAEIIAVSGRDASCRTETEEWLKKHEVPFDTLFMRPEKDQRKDSLIKEEIYNNHIRDNYNVVMIFDDRDQVVETWRKLGLKCAQVEPGKF